jgi:glycosyltransferase involved in cell wall biosynthesis
MQPLISIVTTLYNYARYIEDLAISILNQTWRNWEWIVVDDCSTDQPLYHLEQYLDIYPSIRPFRLDKNMGYSHAKNVGIRHSRGEYIVMIDADDMLTPKSLELRFKHLAGSPLLWVHGECQVLQAGGTLSDESRLWKRNFRKKLIADGMDLKTEYHHRLIHAQSVMVRRELHKMCGLYDDELRFSSDNEMWRRVIGMGHLPCHIDDYVAIYRVHPDRMARSAYKKKHGPKVKQQIIKDVERRVTEGIEERLKWCEK